MFVLGEGQSLPDPIHKKIVRTRVTVSNVKFEDQTISFADDDTTCPIHTGKKNILRMMFFFRRGAGVIFIPKNDSQRGFFRV